MIVRFRQQRCLEAHGIDMSLFTLKASIMNKTLYKSNDFLLAQTGLWMDVTSAF